MKREDNILNELKELNSIYLINGIECPFLINHNYFSENSHKILDAVYALDSKDDPILHLPRIIEKEENWEVPNQYFQNLPEQLLQKVKAEAENADIFAILPQSPSPYVVDSSYFENNLTSILEQVSFEDEPKLSNQLEALRNTNPYQLTPTYFNDLAGNTLTNIQTTEDTIDNTITFQPKTKKAKSWLVAAAVILLASFGVNRFLDMETELQSHEEKKNTLLASISNSSIDEYINYNLDEFEMTTMSYNTTPIQLLNNIPNTEIDAYLELMN